ncbi:MAG: RDD family protein [Rhodanobacter sp.]
MDLSATPPTRPLWRRLAAVVYDLLAVVAIVMVVGLLCQLATGGTLISTAAAVHIPVWYRPLQGIVIAAYFIASWRFGGQTLGMRPWRIRLLRQDGGRPSLQQLAIRLVVAAAPLLALSLAPLLGLRTTLWVLAVLWTSWFVPTLFDARNRALHDFAAGTEIRRIN